MNKKEFIDKAVDVHNGVYPSEFDSFRFGFDGVTIYRSEFTKRARELGLINGYKWGVEYETNGKKPDLPDDVVVDVCYMGAWVKTRQRLVGDWGWADPSVTDFIIVDERYKPVEVERVQAEKPKKDLSDAIFAMLDAVDVLIDAGETEYAKQLKDAVGVMQAKQRQKLADEERQKFVQLVVNALHYSHVKNEKEIAERLYDAGCRFTENKAAS